MVSRLYNTLQDAAGNTLGRYYLSVELASAGDTHRAFLEMIRFLGAPEVTESSPEAIRDAEKKGRKLLRRWEKELSGSLLPALRDALEGPGCNPLIRYELALELAEAGETRDAYMEMIRFLRDAKVTGSSAKVMIDAEYRGKRLARGWEKTLGDKLLTRVGRGRRLSVTCPSCQAKLKASLDVIDDSVVCTKCHNEFPLPYAARTEC